MKKMELNVGLLKSSNGKPQFKYFMSTQQDFKRLNRVRVCVVANGITSMNANGVFFEIEVQGITSLDTVEK